MRGIVQISEQLTNSEQLSAPPEHEKDDALFMSEPQNCAMRGNEEGFSIAPIRRKPREEEQCRERLQAYGCASTDDYPYEEEEAEEAQRIQNRPWNLNFAEHRRIWGQITNLTKCWWFDGTTNDAGCAHRIFHSSRHTFFNTWLPFVLILLIFFIYILFCFHCCCFFPNSSELIFLFPFYFHNFGRGWPAHTIFFSFLHFCLPFLSRFQASGNWLADTSHFVFMERGKQRFCW